MADMPYMHEIDRGVACELAQRAAEMPLPHRINTACGTKAMAIAAAFHVDGAVGLEHMRTARSYIPDLSAAGQRYAYQTGKIMHSAAQDRLPTFTERLAYEKGVEEGSVGVVDFKGARFTCTSHAAADVISMEATDNRGVHRYWSIAEQSGISLFCNHIAFAVGQFVIDPGFDETAPLTFAEWKECQGYPQAVIMSGEINLTQHRLDLHADLLSYQGLVRLRGIVQQLGITAFSDLATVIQSADYYGPIMQAFFSLEQHPPDSHGFEERYANFLRDSILRNPPYEYALTDDREASRASYENARDRLTPVTIYEEWLRLAD